MLRFASDQPTDKKVIPIDPLIERTCASARHPARAAGAQLVFEAEGDGPLVEASALELELAIGNLIENAMLSRADGAAVCVRRFVEGGSVHVEVRDDGDGIPPEALGRILEPFFTTRLATGGTGLGLSVAHGIARDHGGALSLRSLPERGTAVTLSIPLAANP